MLDLVKALCSPTGGEERDVSLLPSLFHEAFLLSDFPLVSSAGASAGKLASVNFHARPSGDRRAFLFTGMKSEAVCGPVFWASTGGRQGATSRLR
jgi:hypothetical protein